VNERDTSLKEVRVRIFRVFVTLFLRSCGTGVEVAGAVQLSGETSGRLPVSAARCVAAGSIVSAALYKIVALDGNILQV
jgi:hypothetical protein